MNYTLRLSIPVMGTKDTFSAQSDYRNLMPQPAKLCGFHPSPVFIMSLFQNDQLTTLRASLDL
jgi:hypothetical protein